ncbi:hypothetical protein ACFLTS_04845 [Chloroflexota bacterium]
MVRKLERKYTRPEEMPVNCEPQRWEEWEVGIQMGPIEYRIKPSTHLRHCELLNIHLPWFEVEWNLFPWEIIGWARAISQYYGRLNGGIQPYFRSEFYHPAKVGQPLFATHFNVDKFIQRGKKFCSVRDETRDENGVLLQQTVSANVFLADVGDDFEFGSSKRHNEGRWTDLGEHVKASKDLPDGLVILTMTKGPCPMRVSGFSHGGWSLNEWQNNIHEDGFSQKLGYAGGVVEGPIAWEYGQLEQLVNFFGAERFYTSGVADVKVCGPTYLGDTLIAKARVREKVPEDGGIRLVIDTRIEKPDGSLVNVGTASALL